jgi:transcription antitermination factor NusG
MVRGSYPAIPGEARPDSTRKPKISNISAQAREDHPTRPQLTTVVAPFFPRYMFIILDPARDQWRRVNGTLGVGGMVMQGDPPQPVPPGIVETLIASTASDGLLQLRPQLNVGDPVRLTQGPFAEYLGTLDRLDDSGRVRVLLDMLGRHVPILVEGHHVGRVARSPPASPARPPLRCDR